MGVQGSDAVTRNSDDFLLDEEEDASTPATAQTRDQTLSSRQSVLLHGNFSRFELNVHT